MNQWYKPRRETPLTPVRPDVPAAQASVVEARRAFLAGDRDDAYALLDGVQELLGDATNPEAAAVDTPVSSHRALRPSFLHGFWRRLDRL